MDSLKTLVIPVALSVLFAFLAYIDMAGGIVALKGNNPNFAGYSDKNIAIIPALPLRNTIIKDTVFVAGDCFIQISLKEQLCYLYERNMDTPTIYKISSGNPNIPKGIETSQGLFTVQTKNPLGHSKQFENAELWNWIGFNVNIGLHGLKANGYYSLLGVRPSSHGCVRMKREDGKEMYSRVKFGTPVLCYKDEPAVTLAFAKDNGYEENFTIIPEDARIFKKEIQNRLNNLYNGMGLVGNTTKLLLDGETIIRWGGYPIGNADSIAYTQKIPIVGIRFPNHNYDALDIFVNVLEKYEEPDTDNDKHNVELN